jgi:hypothetical protein
MNADVCVALELRLVDEVVACLLRLIGVAPGPLADARELVVSSIGSTEPGLRACKRDQKSLVLAE